MPLADTHSHSMKGFGGCHVEALVAVGSPGGVQPQRKKYRGQIDKDVAVLAVMDSKENSHSQLTSLKKEQGWAEKWSHRHLNVLLRSYFNELKQQCLKFKTRPSYHWPWTAVMLEVSAPCWLA